MTNRQATEIIIRERNNLIFLLLLSAEIKACEKCQDDLLCCEHKSIRDALIAHLQN